MPMIRSLYPPNWDAIARQIKRSAFWTCENCQKPCLLPGEDWLDFIVRLGWTVGEAVVNSPHPKRYELDCAHPHHDPENLDAELRAWCAPCHARYDLRAMPLKQQLKRERHGQINLFKPLSAIKPELAGNGNDPSRIQLPIREESQ